MSEPKRYLITSALPYANGPLHIGQIAGAYLPADIFVRFLRLQGKDVAYICGSDEHGAAVTLQAKKEGTTPKAIVDKYHELIEKTFLEFGMSFDFYHRTSAELHHQTAADFFKVLYDKGEFIEKTTQQYFDEEHQQFLADRYITGTCPKCGHGDAYGDQCEKCGSSLSPKELLRPQSTLSGNTPVLKETKHWYLPMDKFEPWLQKWIVEDHKGDWKPNVYGQCKSWIDGGLKPRAMTRDLEWGVKVPLEGAEGKVLYVWLDAPIGYISSTKQWAAEKGKNWEDYWKSKDCRLIHFIGKDNIVFHCIIFPILLKAHGEFILPDNVPANEFLNLEGDKISTSRNHAVWLHEYLEDFPGKQDELRYVLTSIMPESKDSEFTWQDYQARVNNELVATLGNFVNRVMVLTDKHFKRIVPKISNEHFPSLIESFDPMLKDYTHLNYREFEILRAYLPLSELEGTPLPNVLKIGNHLHRYEFRNALNMCMNLVRTANWYITEKEPWKVVKGADEDALEKVAITLHTCLQVVANISIFIRPFLPNTSEKILSQLKYDGEWNWQDLGRLDLLKVGHQLNKPELLFEKVEDEAIERQQEKLRAQNKPGGSSPSKHKPVKEEITFDDFTKLDMRIGTILSAEKHPDADKLLVLKVETGVGERTVVSGIAEHFSPDDIVGQKVSILLNLAPRKIRGIESQGMILMAEQEGGEMAFVTPSKELASGSEIS